MCFAVNQANKKALIEQLELWTKKDLIKLGWNPKRWTNAFAHPMLPIILSEPREVEMASWGLIPNWVKTEDQAKEISVKTLNAKSETMFQLPSFRASAPNKRCLIPVNGFFEYQHRDGGKTKIPHFIHLKDSEVMYLGGLWTEWNGIFTFSICTMDANSLMAEIHNSKKRMPVIIRPELLEAWLDPGVPEVMSVMTTPSDDTPLVAEETEKDSPAAAEASTTDVHKEPDQGVLF